MTDIVNKLKQFQEKLYPKNKVKTPSSTDLEKELKRIDERTFAKIISRINADLDSNVKGLVKVETDKALAFLKHRPKVVVGLLDDKTFRGIISKNDNMYKFYNKNLEVKNILKPVALKLIKLNPGGVSTALAS